jgi:hypothetical protein
MEKDNALRLVLKKVRKASNPHDFMVQPEHSEKEEEIIDQAEAEIKALFKPMGEEEIEKIITQVFAEENKHDGNFLCKSAFWDRYTHRGDCNSGDEYSKPNIKGIVSALSNKISGGEKEENKCDTCLEICKATHKDRLSCPLYKPQPQNNIEEKPAKIERLDENKKHYLGDIYKKLNKVIDAINEIRGR